MRMKYEKVLKPWIFQVNNRMLEKTCQPKTHLMFLKTHKTASSTVLNILYRFGDARNLTFALPYQYYFGYPYLFKATMVKSYSPEKAQKFHILCHHMRFYKPQVEKVMPNGTFYVSILRNPVTLMESSFTYYKGSCSVFRKVNSLTQFLADPWKYYSPDGHDNQYARNTMWFDFGFDNNANDTEEYVDFVINEIENTFHLILISEYFDESMVLLKDALCWEFDDVVSFKLNVRNKVTVRSLSEVDVKRIKAWNSLDWRLYLHFNQTFWQKVEQYGRKRMADDVLVLQRAGKELGDLCLNGSRPVDTSQIQDKKLKPYQQGNARIMGYNLNTNLDESTWEKCIRMVTPELQYKDRLDAKLFPP
ncbi:galactose-3-O-sulfotransferase 2-like isoform X2 [Pristis pectinata]|nr:galactose-3-O-sulfotransferase 2-like isoform X2 [Pristis pectinata]XP_051900704.1 galactose-3-O-sulfotransferase 2-like isoform X2 [Pristis pectinata]